MNKNENFKCCSDVTLTRSLSEVKFWEVFKRGRWSFLSYSLMACWFYYRDKNILLNNVYKVKMLKRKKLKKHVCLWYGLKLLKIEKIKLFFRRVNKNIEH